MFTHIPRSLALGLLVLILGACGLGDSSEKQLARANQFIADADYKAAIIALKSVLQEDSQSGQARYLLGKAYLASGDAPSAAKELQRALQLGWLPDEVVPELAEAMLAQNQYSEVRDLTATGLSAASKTRLLALQARAALGLGDTWDAEGLIEEALAASPDSSDALLVKTRLLLGKQDMAAAQAAIDRVLALDPRNSEAWSLRGDMLALRQNFPESLAAYDKALEVSPDSFDVLYKRAILKLQQADYAGAQADTDRLLAIAPRQPAPNYLQGLLHFQAGRYGEAVTSLSVVEPAFQKFPLALFFLASAQFAQGNRDQAAALAERFHALAPDSAQGRKLLATIRLQDGKYASVRSLLQPVVDANPDDVDALNLTANAWLREGRTNEGIDLLARVAALQPDSAAAQVRLGAGLIMGGKNDDAEQHMETALQLNPEFQQADILLVLNHLKKKDFPAAIEAAEAYRRRNLTSVTPLNLLGRVYLEAGDRDKARDTFQSALALDAGDVAANHNLAQMAIADNDTAAARGYYQAVLEQHPDAAGTLVQLALLDAREENETAMVAHLEEAMKAAPEALQPRLMLARYYLGKSKPEQVAPLFNELDKKQQQSPEVLRLLAIAQLAGKESDAAQFTLEQLLASTPDSASIRHMMAMAAAGAGDTERAGEELRRAVALDENFVPSRIALARLALAENSQAEFRQQLEKLVALAPDNPDVLLLQATAERQDGHPEAAYAFAEKALAKAPASVTLLAAAAYQQAAGDSAGAEKRYSDWLAEHPDDNNVRLAYANSLQQAQRYQEAGRLYAQVIEAQPDNAIALNNQAWILRDTEPAKALEYARKAAELAPQSADILDTLAVVEYANEDFAHARRSIQRALAANPGHPTIVYHSAMIDAAAGEPDKARATLEKLLATHPNFPEHAEAESLLANLRE